MSSGVSVNLYRQRAAWIGLIALAAAAVLLAGQSNFAANLGLGDYIAYWSAGRVNAGGGNPYSPEALLHLQAELGWSESFPNMMYYPPWTLALVMPFGVLPFGVSRLAWLVLHLGLVVLCADWLWRYYGGPTKNRSWAWVIALTFVPTLIVVRMGQIGPLLLLGIVGFLYFEKRGLDWLAGAALLLPAVKPHLVYLFGLAVLIWVVDRRRWRVLVGGGLAFLSATAIALLANLQVLGQYRYALSNPPSGNITPTLGAFIRLAFGEDETWLQFVPTVVGLAWFPFYWRSHRQTWSWEVQAPVLLLVSFLTTCYGAWIFDLVILLVPLLQAAVWVASERRRALQYLGLGCYLVIDCVALAMNLCGASYPAFIWMTPAILLCYLALRRWRAGTGPQYAFS
jgi:hypothetical protein